MQVISINVQITKTPRQFESVRLGIEASINGKETAEEAIKEATERLNALYEEMYVAPKKAPQAEEKAPQTEEAQEKELLTFGDKRLQKITARIEKAGNEKAIKEIFDNVNKYYRLTAEAQRALNLAVKIN